MKRLTGVRMLGFYIYMHGPEIVLTLRAAHKKGAKS